VSYDIFDRALERRDAIIRSKTCRIEELEKENAALQENLRVQTDWIEHQPPVKHDGGPCPCPEFLVVEKWSTDNYNEYKQSSDQRRAGDINWKHVKYWRPADPDWECSFDLDRLVAYRKRT